MRRRKQAKIVVSVLILAVLVTQGSLYAQMQFAHRGWFGMGRGLLGQLQLTDDQRAQIRGIFASGRENLRGLHQQIWEKRKAFRNAATAEPFDEVLVRSQAQELANVQAEVMAARAKLMNDALKVLSAEQKAKFNELREARRQRLMDWLKSQSTSPNPS